MKKYAKIVDENLKTVIFGDGTDSEYYKSMGMTEMDIEQAYDGLWYLKGYAPAKPVLTYEEINKAREDYRKEHIDSKTLERQRKQANGTWTDEDERAYLALDAEVTAWIEENLPYTVEK